ncbi:MAG TPA: hypothetical protein VIV58_11365 [Kofleriaceae bacterium]
MRNFIIISTFLGLSALGAGCGKGGLDGKLDELAKIKDEACACKDKACADAAHDKYVAWKKGNSKDDKPSDEQMKKFETLRTELNDCRRKLSDTTPPPPPAGGSAEAPAAPAAGSAAP